MGTETAEKSRRVRNEETTESVLPPSENSHSVYVSPSEFRMRVLRKLVSVDGSNDNKGVKKFQRQDSDRTLKASIVFPNGDVGTIISYERTDSKKETGSETETVGLPNLKGADSSNPAPRYKERPLRLPPIILPRIYNTKPLPLIPRDFSVPTDPPTPITDEEWEDLQECRYLRQYSPRKYRSTSIYG